MAVQGSPDRKRESALSKVKLVAEGLEEELFLAESLRHDAEVWSAVLCLGKTHERRCQNADGHATVLACWAVRQPAASWLGVWLAASNEETRCVRLLITRTPVRGVQLYL